MKRQAFRFVRLIVVVALFATLFFHAVPRASAAPINVDDFNRITDALVLGVTLANTPQFGFTTDPSILGNERDVTGIVITGTGTLSINASDPTGYFSHSQPVGLRGRSIITWDGPDGNPLVNPTGLGGIDATGGGTNDMFLVGSVSNDVATQLQILVYTDAANWSQQTISVTAGSSQQSLSFTFAGFTPVGGAGANFTNVGAVQLIINSAATPTAALDMIIDFFAITNSTSYQDYGDLPDTYSTLAASNGPRHTISTLFLGSLIDAEPNGQPTPTATGDNVTNLNDEDGVVRSAAWTNGPNGGHVQVTVTGANNACLSGWIDFGQDGTFTNTEQIFNLVHVTGGVNTLNFDVPPGTFPGTGPNITLNARFRVVPDVFADGLCLAVSQFGDEADLSYTGPYLNGEIEDYQWPFNPTAVHLSMLKAESSASPVLPLTLAGLTAALLVSSAIVIRRKKRV